MAKKLMTALPALEIDALSHAADYDTNGMVSKDDTWLASASKHRSGFRGGGLEPPSLSITSFWAWWMKFAYGQPECASRRC